MKQSLNSLFRVLSIIFALVIPFSSGALQIDNTHYRFCVMDDATITDYAAVSAKNSDQLPSFASARWSGYHGVELKAHEDFLKSNYSTYVPALMTQVYSGNDASIVHKWVKGFNGVGYDQYTYFYIEVNAPSGVALYNVPAKMLVNDEITLQKSLEGSYESFSGNGYFDYDYSSSATDILSVVNGKVTANKVGKATVTVKAYARNHKYDGSYYIGSTSAEIEVVDNLDPVDIILSQHELTLNEGEEKALAAMLTPEDARTTLTWKSSNPMVASVTNGVIQALQRGQTIIEVSTTNALSAKCYVTVLGDEDYKQVMVNNLYFDINRLTKTASVVPKETGNDNNGYVWGEITVPETIGFYGNDYTVTEIGNQAFFNCNVSSVILPASVTKIGEFAFSNTELNEIELPETLTEIGNFAFYGSRIESIIIGPAVTTIGNGAFGNCESLSAIYVDNDNRHFEMYSDCLYTSGRTNLFYIPMKKSKIVLSGDVRTIRSFACVNNSLITEIDFPIQLENIGANAFQDCNKLSSIILPSTTLGIEDNAFSGCNALRKVKLLALKPPFVEMNSFSNYNATLIVPKGRVPTYKKHEVWGKFTNVTDDETNGIGLVLTDDIDAGRNHRIYDVTGRLIKSNASKEDWNVLSPGIYIVDGEKKIKN